MRLLLATFLLLALPARAAELLMVTTPGCPFCAKWERDLGAIYPRTEEARRAPLRRVDIKGFDQGITLREKLEYTPTFLIVEDHREVARVTGYQSQDSFWFLLDEALAKLETHE